MVLNEQLNKNIAVVIPCFGVGGSILNVIGGTGPEVHKIYVVDDCCPDKTADLVDSECDDPRIRVIRHSENQ